MKNLDQMTVKEIKELYKLDRVEIFYPKKNKYVNPTIIKLDNIPKWIQREIIQIPTGMCIVCLWEGSTRFVGISKCNLADDFNKKFGRKIALIRAIKTKQIGYSLNDYSFTFSWPNIDTLPLLTKSFKRYIEKHPGIYRLLKS